MESFWGAVKLMFFIYALAAVISLIMAWVMKYLFRGIQMHKSRADARNNAKAAASAPPAKAAPERTA
jgi:hypothetical protein